MRRKAVSKKKLSKNSIIKKNNFEFKRAIGGIFIDNFDKFIGRKIIKSIKKGDTLSEDNIKK